MSQYPFITNIAQEIFEAKYQWNGESPYDFYKRQAKTVYDYIIKNGLIKDEESFINEYYEQKVKTKNLFDIIFDSLYHQEIMTGGRIAYAIGTNRATATFSNCFVLKNLPDSLTGILDVIKDAAITMKAGGGVGFYTGALRPRNAPLLNSGGVSSGGVSFLQVINSLCDTLKTAGNRRGAMLDCHPVWHPDILEFITCKKGRTNAALKNFNLSVGVTSDFMEAVKNEADWDLVFPDFENQKELYEKYWKGDLNHWKKVGGKIKVYSTLKASEIYDAITTNSYKYAEPGMLFMDTINNMSPLNYIEGEVIFTTNPCGEIPLSESGSCNLGGINLSNGLIENPFTKQSSFNYEAFIVRIKTLVLYLNIILEINKYPLPDQEEKVKDTRQIGCGHSGFADALAKLGLIYGSSQSIEFADYLQKIYTGVGIHASILISKLLGITFRKFSKEIVDTPYYKNIESIVKFDNIGEDALKEYSGANLIKKIKKYGIANGTLFTIAPTGTTSLINNNISSGVEPIFSIEQVRNVIEGDGSTTEKYLRDFAYNEYVQLKDDNKLKFEECFTIATEVSPKEHIDVYTTFQKYIDSAISKTINIPTDMNYEEYKKLFMYAYEKGAKGCTTYRQNDEMPSVLSSTSKESKLPVDEKDSNSAILNLGKEVPAIRHIIEVKDGKVYMTITLHNKLPVELFMTLPRSIAIIDGQFNPIVYFRELEMWTLISRLISLILRTSVIPYSELLNQLKDAQFDYYGIVNKLIVILEKYNVTELETCPECNSGTLIHIEGCKMCTTCGYSPCEKF
jgi:ribonucleoside-diphosphate reductase alpha chain